MFVVLGIFLSGCASIQESEFAKHPYSFQSMDHMRFSLQGYHNPTDETAKKTQEEDWWGMTIE